MSKIEIHRSSKSRNSHSVTERSIGSEARDRALNLTGANLSQADLRGVTFTHTIFDKTDMSGVSLIDVDLTQADLRYALIR